VRPLTDVPGSGGKCAVRSRPITVSNACWIKSLRGRRDQHLNFDSFWSESRRESTPVGSDLQTDVALFGLCWSAFRRFEPGSGRTLLCFCATLQEIVLESDLPRLWFELRRVPRAESRKPRLRCRHMECTGRNGDLRIGDEHRAVDIVPWSGPTEERPARAILQVAATAL
jgi:hypothetical protein